MIRTSSKSFDNVFLFTAGSKFSYHTTELLKAGVAARSWDQSSTQV